LSYLLDTNACIALKKRHPASVDERLQGALAARAQVSVSSISVHELWFGVANSAHAQQNTARLKTFLAGPYSLLAFDEEDAKTAGSLRAQLDALGTSIGPYDLLLAGQALRRGMTLITANEREFARVPGLRWENWAAKRV